MSTIWNDLGKILTKLQGELGIKSDLRTEFTKSAECIPSPAVALRKENGWRYRQLYSEHFAVINTAPGIPSTQSEVRQLKARNTSKDFASQNQQVQDSKTKQEAVEVGCRDTSSASNDQMTKTIGLLMLHTYLSLISHILSRGYTRFPFAVREAWRGLSSPRVRLCTEQKTNRIGPLLRGTCNPPRTLPISTSCTVLPQYIPSN